MHAFDRQTDRQTEISSLDRVCIACSAVTKLQYTVCTSRCLNINCDHARTARAQFVTRRTSNRTSRSWHQWFIDWLSVFRMDLQHWRTTLGNRVFPVAAARAWNALPPSVRTPSMFLVSGSELKRYCSWNTSKMIGHMIADVWHYSFVRCRYSIYV